MDQVDYRIKKRFIELHKDGECFRKLDLWFFKRHLKALQKAKDLEAMIAAIEKEAAWNYLLRALGKKDYFCREIKDKMRLRYVSDETIESVIAKAESFNYLDDARLLKNAIEWGIAKGKGPYRLVQELARRSGLAKALIEKQVAEALPENTLVEKAQKLIKRYKLPQERQKAYAFLARRGFPNDVIQKVLQIHI